MRRKKTATKIVLLLITCIFILTFPTSAFAYVEFFEFQSIDDGQLLIGETKNIKLKVYDEENDPYTGNLSATITDSEGISKTYSISGGQGNYTVSNVALDYEGRYELLITDNVNNAYGTLIVTKPVVELENDIIKNKKTFVTGILKDFEGNRLDRKSITVDGSEIGISSTQNYTTSFDGTFSFYITPTEIGKLKFLFSGHEIGEINVQPSYVHKGRIGGIAQNNIELSISVAQEGWISASTVILTRDDDLADSLTAVPLSKKYNAPIFMTTSDSLDPRILTEIGYLKARNVIIIGGEGAISKGIENSLLNLDFTVDRIAGADRYETAALIASRFSSSGTVYLAYGQGEPDAIAASSFAAVNSIPILLTDKNKIPVVTQQQLKRLNPNEVIILGGNGVVEQAVQDELGKTYLTERWGGADRYDTEWAILRKLFANESRLYFSSALVSPNDVGSGKPYGDALLAASLAAKNNAVSINIPPNYLPKSIDYFLLYNLGYISEARIIGNTSAITPILEKQIERLLTR